ncbi:diguanylate cyclase domain-containing protein [Rhizobium helianthi]|uniref:diguanylate cyclase n=1 Tax=Rhizobium helianthi TaxID=1132695 RepID=A0ABW4M3U3_9HYPH
MGADVPVDVRMRLYAALASSTVPVIFASLNSAFVAVIAFFRSGNRIFLLFALIDILGLSLRVAAPRLKIMKTFASDVVILTGLLWALMVGLNTMMIGIGDDTAMIVLSVASALGCCAGIISRNYVTPRMGLAQVIVIDLGFKISFGISHPEFLPVILLQGVIFCGIVDWMMRQQLATSVQAISSELESRRQALLDPLTGVLNRRGLHERAQHMMAKQQLLALFYLDLDGFKQVNDRLGHGAGDDLLRQVAKRLEATEPGAAICRLGGDEFLILAPSHHAQEAVRTASRMIRAMSMPYNTDVGPANVGASIGISFVNMEEGLDRAMKEADAALYRAKDAGRGRAVLHEPESGCSRASA